jgi:peptide/nickel transport system substrate-binding protein
MMPAPMFGRVAAVLAPLVTFLVTFLVAPVLTISSALGQNVPLPTQVVRRELRIGVPGVPAALEPGATLEGAGPLIARQVFDTLVAWREGSTDIEPALATRWHASRDGLVWSFTLREGVKFHDGSPLTALEVAASFERQLKPEAQGRNRAWPALLRGAPGVIKEVRAPGARTVEIVLVQPYAPLVTVLAHPGLAIAKPLVAADGAGRLIGTGPYRVVDASPGRLALEAMPGHWAGPAKSERLVFLDVSADDQAESELDARSLDVWFPAVPPRRTQGALSAPGLRIGYLAFQTEKEPFAQRTLRQAVAAAIDPATLGQILDRAAVPLQSFLPPGVWARREGSPILGGGRTTVKALIKESRWPKGAKPTLLVPADTKPLNSPKLAEMIQLLLGSDDLPLNIRAEPEGTARSLLQAGAYDMALTEATVAGGDPHLLLYPLSTSEAATKGPRAMNFSFYRNARLDDVLIRASQLSFRPERQRLYQRSQAMLAEDLPWLPIYVRLQWAVARADVRGLRLHPSGIHRLDTVFLEIPPALAPAPGASR